MLKEFIKYSKQNKVKQSTKNYLRFKDIFLANAIERELDEGFANAVYLDKHENSKRVAPRELLEA